MNERLERTDEGERLVADLHALVHAHRSEILRRAEDWVTSQSIDLRAPASRADTRRLVERLVAAYERALFEGDRTALEEFVAYVTTFRASSAFRVSTVLRGLLSFRAGLQEVLLRERGGDPRVAIMLAKVDEISFEAVFVGADEYTSKVSEAANDAVEGRRKRALGTSVPLVRLDHGVVLLAMPAGLDEERALAVLEHLLPELSALRPYDLVVDLTCTGGPSSVLATLLARLLAAARLGGSSCAVAGLDPATFHALSTLEPALESLPTYASLQLAVVAALARTSSTVRGGRVPRP